MTDSHAARKPARNAAAGEWCGGSVGGAGRAGAGGAGAGGRWGGGGGRRGRHGRGWHGRGWHGRGWHGLAPLFHRLVSRFRSSQTHAASPLRNSGSKGHYTIFVLVAFCV